MAVGEEEEVQSAGEGIFRWKHSFGALSCRLDLAGIPASGHGASRLPSGLEYVYRRSRQGMARSRQAWSRRRRQWSGS